MTDKPTRQLSDKLIVAIVAMFALGAILYFALGMPGMDHGSNSSMDGMDMSSDSSAHRIVDPAMFASALAEPGAVVINVHVPYDGEIDGTHLFMPFDEIDEAVLPSDRDTPLVVYCRSGSMSSTAIVTLVGLGYTNIVELDGGMNAWKASGRSVTMSPAGG